MAARRRHPSALRFRRIRSLLVACSVLAAGACGGDGSESSRDDDGGTTTSASDERGGTTTSSRPDDSGTTTTATTATTAPATAEGFAGEWDSTFGVLLLEVSGAQVEGTYEFCAGTLSGTLSGAVLEGTWTEDTSACQDPVSAARPVADGTFSFTLDPGSETFTGSYLTTGFPEVNEWNGTRIG